MPILFSFLAGHRDFPSDSDSDDPDFIDPTTSKAGSLEQRSASGDSDSSASVHEEAASLEGTYRTTLLQRLTKMDKEVNNESDKVSSLAVI